VRYSIQYAVANARNLNCPNYILSCWCLIHSCFTDRVRYSLQYVDIGWIHRCVTAVETCGRGWMTHTQRALIGIFFMCLVSLGKLVAIWIFWPKKLTELTHRWNVPCLEVVDHGTLSTMIRSDRLALRTYCQEKYWSSHLQSPVRQSGYLYRGSLPYSNAARRAARMNPSLSW
jgi:hypothetical protein